MCASTVLPSITTLVDTGPPPPLPSGPERHYDDDFISFEDCIQIDDILALQGHIMEAAGNGRAEFIDVADIATAAVVEESVRVLEDDDAEVLIVDDNSAMFVDAVGLGAEVIRIDNNTEIITDAACVDADVTPMFVDGEGSYPIILDAKCEALFLENYDASTSSAFVTQRIIKCSPPSSPPPPTTGTRGRGLVVDTPLATRVSVRLSNRARAEASPPPPPPVCAVGIGGATVATMITNTTDDQSEQLKRLGNRGRRAGYKNKKGKRKPFGKVKNPIAHKLRKDMRIAQKVLKK